MTAIERPAASMLAQRDWKTTNSKWNIWISASARNVSPVSSYVCKFELIGPFWKFVWNELRSEKSDSMRLPRSRKSTHAADLEAPNMQLQGLFSLRETESTAGSLPSSTA